MKKSILKSLVVPVAIVALAVFPALVLAQTTSNVSAIDNSFSPNTLTVNEGDTVTWTNNGAMNHTVTADDGSFDSGTLSPGATFSHTFTSAGTVAYHCTFHGASGGVGMSGAILVMAATNSSATSTENSTSTSTATTTPSITEPIISNIAAMSSNDGTMLTVTWTTDQASNSQVSWGTTSAYTASSTLDTNLVGSHSVMISGLTPNTMYHFAVMSDNGSGHVMSSPDQTVMTANPSSTGTSTPTTTEPVISNVTAMSSNDGTMLTVTWITDQASNSQVSWGTTSAYTASSTLDTSLVGSHSVMISGLTPNTTYHFAVMSDNGSGHVTSSPDQTVMTAAVTSGGGNGNNGNGDENENSSPRLAPVISRLQAITTELQQLIDLLNRLIQQGSRFSR